jgi:hypothetical protein
MVAEGFQTWAEGMRNRNAVKGDDVADRSNGRLPLLHDLWRTVYLRRRSGQPRWVSTRRLLRSQELQHVLEDHSATVFDASPYLESAAGHIPGALNVSAKQASRCPSTSETWPVAVE